MTSLNTNISPMYVDASMPALVPASQSVVVDTPPAVAHEAWEDIKDSQSSIAGGVSVPIEQTIDATVPIMPAPGTPVTASILNINIQSLMMSGIDPTTNVMKNTLNNILTGGLKTAQDAETAAVDLSKKLPSDNSNQVSIKEFIGAIRSAIDQLKRTLADIQKQDVEAKSKTDAANAKTQVEKMNYDKELQARGETRKKIDQAGKMKAWNTVFKILEPLVAFTCLAMIPLPIPIFQILAIALLVISLVDSIPGPSAGFMNKAAAWLDSVIDKVFPGFVNQDPALKAFVRCLIVNALAILVLGPFAAPVAAVLLMDTFKIGLDEGNKLRTKEIKELNAKIDGLSPPIAAAIRNTHISEEEKTILEMIGLLMKMLAQILMGGGDSLDIAKMTTMLSSIKDRPISPEFIKEMKSMESAFGDFSPDKDSDTKGFSPSAKQAFKAGMQAMAHYELYRKKGDTIGSNEALDALQKALTEISGEMEKSKEYQALKKNSVDITKVVSQGSGDSALQESALTRG